MKENNLSLRSSEVFRQQNASSLVRKETQGRGGEKQSDFLTLAGIDTERRARRGERTEKKILRPQF